MRRGSTSAVATVFAFLAMTFAGPLHLLTQQHVICPVDGQLVHVDYEDIGETHAAHAHGPHAGLAEPAPIDAPGPTTPPPTGHTHDHPCALTLQLSAPGGSASTTTTLADRRDFVVLPTTAPASPRRVIDTIFLAPSHSPPA